MTYSRVLSVVVLIAVSLLPCVAKAESPELVVLRQQYEKLLADRVTSVYEAGVHQLNDGYSAGVNRSITSAKTAGDLQMVNALEGELKSLQKNEPFPPDDAQAVAPLKKLRPIYRTQLAKLDEQRSANQIALLTPYVAKLKQLEATLTKSNRADEAKAVLDYRESLGAGITAVKSTPPLIGASAGFTNTLGMKFVPVSGINVLFCIHETRRKDFTTFAAEVPGQDGVWKSDKVSGVLLEDADNQPASGVKYDDAVAFCQWLSKKEGKMYRLPTDREWSYAAGIGQKEKWTTGTTPEMRKNLKAGDFPWGKNFPPDTADKPGNYNDTSRHERFPGDPYISEYTDGFVVTSPVMSFKPNEQGLYDMGGNVWEWVEDWWNEKKSLRVLRGGSWITSSREEMLTSGRVTSSHPGVSYYHAFGFRVVLEIQNTSGTPVAITPPLPTPVAAITPTTTPTTTPPASTPVASQSSAPSQPPAGIVLDHSWNTPMQGGSATMKELGTLLSPFAKASANMSPSPTLQIYEGVTYLMPYEEAKKALNLTQKSVPKNIVACPGFPVSSLFTYAFEGVFEGHFNKLYLVADKADQVVAVELVAETPKRDQVDAPDSRTDGHTYDFINIRTKATTTLWIDHKPFYQDGDHWQKFNPKNSSKLKGEVGLLRIDSLLMDPASIRGHLMNREPDWKPLKAMRLYLPKPLMELILQCIGGGIH